MENDKLLAFVAQYSEYFRDLLQQYHDQIYSPPADGEYYENVQYYINQIYAINHTNDVEFVQSELRHRKNLAQFWAGIMELSGEWRLEDCTKFYSDIADACVQIALKTIIHQLQANNIIANDAGLFSVAMGKLGARELNFSSDIDCILIYDEEICQITNPDRFNKELRNAGLLFIRLLNEYTADGFVYRTDLRLRPDPSVTPLIVSTSSALRYYQSTGAFWERMAHIKARIHAGNVVAGQKYLTQIQPFIFRRKLDFLAIDEMAQIRARILQNLDKFEGLYNLDIKLSHGGIRSIEFITQSLQIVYGGKYPQLQGGQTIEMLGELYKLQKITDHEFQILTSAYYFYRKLEHYLQMLQNEQTHHLPKTAESFAHFAGFLRMEPQILGDKILFFMNQVQAIENQYFGEYINNLRAEEPIKNDTPHHISAESLAIMNVWQTSPYKALKNEKSNHYIIKLIQKITILGHDDKNINDKILLFDTILQKIPQGLEFLVLLDKNPAILPQLFAIFSHSDLCYNYILENPIIIESVLLRHNNRETLENIIKHEFPLRFDYNDLDRIGHSLYQQYFLCCFSLYYDFIIKNQTPARLSHKLSRLRSAVISEATQFLANTYSDNQKTTPDGRDIAILALGKLGVNQLHPLSDSDCMVIYQPANNCRAGYYTKLTSRLGNFLGQLGVHGKMIDWDLRLRPDGEDGAICVQFDGFCNYYQTRAWVWEEIALVKARIIYAPPPLQANIEQAIRAILTKPRQLSDIATACHEMLEKIWQAKKPDDWDLKNRPGGTMQADFIVNGLTLYHAHQYPELAGYFGNINAHILANLGILTHTQANDINSALEFYHQITTLTHLHNAQKWHKLSPPQQWHTAQQCGYASVDNLLENINKHAGNVARIFACVYP